MTVGRLLREIDSRELTEWQVYERRTGPLGQPRDDILAGIVAMTVHNSQAKKALKIHKFVPDWTASTPVDEEAGAHGDDQEHHH